MRRENAQALPGLHIPDPYRLVEGPGGDHVGLRVEDAAKGEIGVPCQGFEQGRGFKVPDTDCAVVGGGAEEATVGGEGEVGDTLRMSGELGPEGDFGVGERVEAEGLVGRGGGEEGAIGGELHGGDGVLVAGEGGAKGVGRGDGRKIVGGGGHRGGSVFSGWKGILQEKPQIYQYYITIIKLVVYIKRNKKHLFLKR